MRIDTSFEGGRVETVGRVQGTTVRLAIPTDPVAPRYRQWFAFAAKGGRGAKTTFQIMNAGESTWAKGFAGYRVFASTDGERWKRIPTSFDGKTLSWSRPIGAAPVLFAYFPPFSNDRMDALVAYAESVGAEATDLAVTPRGGHVRLLSMGQKDEEAPAVWVIAQQHPGETMAGWFMEGLVLRLTNAEDEAARALLERARVYLVPRMNPDGCALGNHRTNGAGIDLNRQWAEPSEEALEVVAVRAAMAERGVDAFLDVHGDETIPYVFAQGTPGVPRRTDADAARERMFVAAMLETTEDFQTERGYPNDGPGAANLAIAANWVADTFGALSMTLEMPFTRHGGARGAEWTPERSSKLGHDTVEALAAYVAGGAGEAPADDYPPG